MEDESRLQLVSRIGTQLAQLNRFNKDVFLKSLKQAVTALSEIEQPLSSEASKEQVIKKLDATTQPLRESIISHSLLQKNDKEVRLYVASCITEMFRVLAPERPFEAKYLRGIFRLIVSIFTELRDTGCPFFPKRVKLLETVARCKCFVPIMEIDDDLVLEMFNIFFLVVSEHHQFSSVSCMLSILTHILDEAASQPLLEVILRNIVDQGKDASPAASQLATSVIQSRTEMLEPFVSGFLTSCIANRDAVGSELGEYYHEIIFKLFQSAPRMLLTVMPKLIQELLVDQVDVRIKAVNLIGKMLALPKNCLAEKYHDLFVEFLRRFSDKSAEVRLRALRCAKACYLANQSGANSHEILTTLRGRLLDYDDRLRLEAMTVVCDLAKSNLENFPPKFISEAAERLRDKKVSVRKKALQKLLEVYRDYCKRCSEGRIITCDHFEQIPCKVLMLCYEKDCKEFRSQNIERVLVEDLFPDLEIKERRRHWVHMFSLFNAFHMKALETILSQKQRLRAELQLYLSLRKKEKGVSLDEMHKRTRSSFMKMAAFFPDPSKAEESFERLNSMKDNNIFYALEDLLDKLTIKDARIVRDKFLKLVGNKHPDLEFLQLLSSKCLYIFDAELVRCILDDLSSNVVEDNHLEASLIKLLLAIIKIFPSLLRGSEVQLRKFFEENDMIDEKLIEVLAKAGPYISVKFRDFSHFLEKACLEGTRAQAKHAVSAIASLLGSSGQSVLLELCKKLMDSLRGGRNIPTVLQSLGCIAQHYALTCETREEDIRQYIYKNIIQVGPLDDEISFDETADFDASNALKIYGLKTLVKSFLPHKGSHFKQEINDLLVVLSKMLKKADTFDAHISCESNEAHIRLAAGKAVLRLSRQWDLHISPEIFHATVLLAKDSSTFVRRSFIDKTHKLLKAHLIPNRYACALVLAAANCSKDFQDDSFKYMAEFIKERSREAQTRQKSAVQGVLLTDYPAYIAVFLIHVLAHDTGFPPEDCHDKEKLFQFFRPLFLLLQSLLNASIVDGDMDLISNVTLYLLRIFHGIKKAEDAVDVQRTLNLHILANIGISLITELDRTSVSSARAPGQIILPSSLYKVILAEKSKEASSNCPPLMIDQKFVERVVHILKANISQPARNLKSSKKHQEDIMQLGITKPSTSHLVACKQSDLPASGMIQSKKEHVRPETSLDFKRKQTATPETLAATGSAKKCLTVEGCHNGASKCSEARLEKVLLSSSDSVNVDSSLSDTLILAPTSPKHAAHLKENVMPATLITAEPARHAEVKLKAPCYEKATRDKRGGELFCLDSDSDSPKMVGDISLSERVLLEADSNTIHLWRGKCSSNDASHSSITSVRRTRSTYGEDAAQLPGAISKQQHGYVHGKADPLAAKRKRGVNHPVRTSAKINVDAIARRTRSRKL